MCFQLGEAHLIHCLSLPLKPKQVTGVISGDSTNIQPTLRAQAFQVPGSSEILKDFSASESCSTGGFPSFLSDKKIKVYDSIKGISPLALLLLFSREPVLLIAR